MKISDMRQRPRRNRKSPSIRALVQETRLNLDQLVYPLFLVEESEAILPISSMPGISRWGINTLLKEMRECVNLGISSFILFPAVDDQKKDAYASYGLDKGNFI